MYLKKNSINIHINFYDGYLAREECCGKTLNYTDTDKPFEFHRSYCLASGKFIHRVFQ